MTDDYDPSVNILNFPELNIESHFFASKVQQSLRMPIYSSKIQAGPPFPIDEYIEKLYDLNSKLLTHPTATCILRAFKDYNLGHGIRKNDIIIVDKSLHLASNKVIIVATNNILTIRRFKIVKDQKLLYTSDESFSYIEMDHQYQFWGIITYVIHKV